LVSQKDPTTNASINQNAGKTQSRGIELSLGRKIIETLKLETALSYAKHEYKEWRGKDASGIPFNYAGNEMASAPRFMGNTRLTWIPTQKTSAQFEWIRVGSYFLQESNAPTTSGTDKGVSKYNGHNIFNFRASYDVCKNAGLFGRVMNIADKRYADSASISSNTAVYSPGLPRTFYAGLEVKW
jgi:iron complex outermembrane recepter protein